MLRFTELVTEKMVFLISETLQSAAIRCLEEIILMNFWQKIC